MSLIDTVKIDSNSIKIYKENKSDKYPNKKKERKHPTTFKLREVLRLCVPSFERRTDGQKKMLKLILKHA